MARALHPVHPVDSEMHHTLLEVSIPAGKTLESSNLAAQTPHHQFATTRDVVPCVLFNVPAGIPLVK